MTKRERKKANREKKSQRILSALGPFLNVPITEEGHVWLYVGKADFFSGIKLRDGTIRTAHLHTDDFKALQEAIERRNE